MARGYASSGGEASTVVHRVTPMVTDELECLAREGARRMIAAMLEGEVSDFLQRARYQRGGEGRGYRNGYAPERTIGVGLGAIPIRVPRGERRAEGGGAGGISLPDCAALSAAVGHDPAHIDTPVSGGVVDGRLRARVSNAVGRNRAFVAQQRGPAQE